MKTMIEQAVTTLNQGKLVAFPTETVYGLGADARNEIAIGKVFLAKGRPANHPLIVHIAKLSDLENWAINIPAAAYKLAEHFWPGPLTLVLEKHPQVSSLITGGQSTVALRIPQHPLTLELLQKFGSGIVGPSANSYGRLSPTTAAHVANDLGSKVDFILDGGPCTVGIESTIVHFTQDAWHILRQGSIGAEQIASVIAMPLGNSHNTTSKVRAPGSCKSHYAPRKQLFLVHSYDLLEIVEHYASNYEQYSYVSLQAAPGMINSSYWQQLPAEPKAYAKRLYACLHKLDADPSSLGIIVEMPPQQEKWAAIFDRLTRASVRTVTTAELEALV